MESIVVEKIERKNKNWRSENMKKAREARMRKLEEKSALIKLEKEEEETLEGELQDSINNLITTSNYAVDKLKTDFYKVFNEIGGVSGMVKWIKSSPMNRKEYYKLFIGLLRSESSKQTEGQKQQVVVNIVTPEGIKETLVSGRTE